MAITGRAAPTTPARRRTSDAVGPALHSRFDIGIGKAGGEAVDAEEQLFAATPLKRFGSQAARFILLGQGHGILQIEDDDIGFGA
jgi:hypothetical protein